MASMGMDTLIQETFKAYLEIMGCHGCRQGAEDLAADTEDRGILAHKLSLLLEHHLNLMATIQLNGGRRGMAQTRPLDAEEVGTETAPIPVPSPPKSAVPANIGRPSPLRNQPLDTTDVESLRERSEMEKTGTFREQSSTMQQEATPTQSSGGGQDGTPLGSATSGTHPRSLPAPAEAESVDPLDWTLHEDEESAVAGPSGSRGRGRGRPRPSPFHRNSSDVSGLKPTSPPHVTATPTCDDVHPVSRHSSMGSVRVDFANISASHRNSTGTSASQRNSTTTTSLSALHLSMSALSVFSGNDSLAASATASNAPAATSPTPRVSFQEGASDAPQPSPTAAESTPPPPTVPSMATAVARHSATPQPSPATSPSTGPQPQPPPSTGHHNRLSISGKPDDTRSRAGVSYAGSFYGHPTTSVTPTLTKGVDGAGFKVINQYTILQYLGAGTSGKVKLASSTTDNESYAVKIVKRKRVRLTQAELHAEAGIMISLHHKHIVPLVEVIDDPSSPKVYMVMPYIDGGPIVQYTHEGRCERTESEDAVQHRLRQLIGGLSYLHSKGIVHCDIKPDNLLMTRDGHVYISDFGSSSFFSAPHKNRGGGCGMGTPLFTAPEAFGTDGASVAPPVDVWSLGVVVYSMLFGRHPFWATTMEDIMHALHHKAVEIPEDVPVSDEAKTLVLELLEKDPAKRITLAELRGHAWTRKKFDRFVPPPKPNASAISQDAGGRPRASVVGLVAS